MLQQPELPAAETRREVETGRLDGPAVEAVLGAAGHLARRARPAWPADLSDEQILERLLALNLERAAEEAKATTIKRPFGSRAKREDEML